MEVKSSSSCSTVEADENIILGGCNKENPWDFIEKEILEFQSIVKELESYSGKSSKAKWSKQWHQPSFQALTWRLSPAQTGWGGFIIDEESRPAVELPSASSRISAKRRNCNPAEILNQRDLDCQDHQTCHYIVLFLGFHAKWDRLTKTTQQQASPSAQTQPQ